MSEERINLESGQKQIKIQPENFPEIWVDVALCERCLPCSECLNFTDISDKAWEEFNNLLSSLNKESMNDNDFYLVKEEWHSLFMLQIILNTFLSQH